MKRQKKQYRPIAGQTWYEKALDRITREEALPRLLAGFGAYAACLPLGVYILANLLEQPDIAERFLGAWLRMLPAAAAVPAVNPLGGIWGLRSERTLRKAVRDCAETYGRCTYGELVAQCMPVKIHLGIDGAIEKMLCSHELILDADARYRLPTAAARAQ